MCEESELKARRKTYAESGIVHNNNSADAGKNRENNRINYRQEKTGK